MGCAGSVTDQSRTVPSSPPVASTVPLGLNATVSALPVAVTWNGAPSGASVLALRSATVWSL